MEGGHLKRRAGTPKAEHPDRPTTAPPATTTTTAGLDSGAKIDLSDLDGANVDQEGLFQTSSDWILLGRAMTVLQEQYEQCLEDLNLLESIKQDALSDPHSFVQRLGAGAVTVPTLQVIYRNPEIDADRFAMRATRRGLNKKEQNAEFLLTRLKELQQRGSVVLPVPLRSDCVTIDPAALSAPATATNHRETFLSAVQEERPPSTASSASLQSSSAAASPSRRKRAKTGSGSQRSHFHSRSSSSSTSSTLPSPHHTYNVPWAKEEKRRLNELLLQYPEEAVAARRYAKIAAAMGTRTPTQVFTRVTKLMASIRAHQLDNSDQEDSDDGVLKKDASSATYKEYMKLKQALEQELVSAGVAPVHTGVWCGQCGAHPIVGVRYRCAQCATDLCDSCFVPGSTTAPHSSHKVQTVPLQPIVDGSQAEFDYLNS